MTTAQHVLVTHVSANSADTTTDERGDCLVCGEPTGTPSREYQWRQWAITLGQQLHDWAKVTPKGATGLYIRVSQETADMIVANLGNAQCRPAPGKAMVWGVPFVVDPHITQVGAVEVCYRHQLPELPA